MTKPQLSKDAKNLLADHAFKISTKGNQVIIQEKSNHTWTIIGFGILVAFIYLLYIQSPISAVLIISMMTISIGLLVLPIKPNKEVAIDSNEKLIKLTQGGTSRVHQIAQISSIKITSRFNGNYTSASKKTNESYKISIMLTTKGGQSLEIFRFNSDYKEPSMAIKELKETLASILRSSQKEKTLASTV